MATVESLDTLSTEHPQGTIVEPGGLGPDLACRSYPHEPPHRGPSLLKFIHAAGNPWMREKCVSESPD